MRAFPVCLLAAVLLAGCGRSVPGQATTPTTAPTTTAAPSAAPVSTPAETPPPDPAFVKAPDLSTGTYVEGGRLAGATLLIKTALPDHTADCSPVGTELDPSKLDTDYFGAAQVAPALRNAGFVVGWGQCQTTADGKRGTVALTTELSDPAAARWAADRLTYVTATAASTGPDTVPNGKVDVAGERVTLPTANLPAVLRRGADADTVQVWLPGGRLLAYLSHQAAPGQGVAEADRLAVEQARLLAGFTPTPQADVAKLPTDPYDLQNHAITLPGDLEDLIGPFDLNSYLRIAIDPARERDVLTANQFAGMFVKQSHDDKLSYAVSVYRFPDSGRTNVAYNAFAAIEAAAYGSSKFTLSSIPTAPCFVLGSADSAGTFTQRCYVGYGPFLASIDVSGVPRADDVASMNSLLPQQRDSIRRP